MTPPFLSFYPEWYCIPSGNLIHNANSLVILPFSDQPEAKQGLGIGMGMAFTGFNVNKAVVAGNKPVFKLPPLPPTTVSRRIKSSTTWAARLKSACWSVGLSASDAPFWTAAPTEALPSRPEAKPVRSET